MQKYLIVGLGNPGANYAKNRHNVGFMVIEELLKQCNLTISNSQFNGMYTQYRTQNALIYFAQPTTYMNLSGDFVLKFIKYYDIPKENLLIIYDDIDLAVGQLRFKASGSAGGQNGMKHIINTLNTNQIKRLRLGIGKNQKVDLAAYVLSNFKSDELPLIQVAIKNAASAILSLLRGESFEQVMNKYN